jgi:predicted Zn-dependent peptidase
MLNRTISPEIPKPEKISIPEPEITTLENGIPLFKVNLGTQDVIKVELVFDAGINYSTAPLIANATNDMLDEGSGIYSSAQIAEMLDMYGAYFQTDCGNDFASVTLYSLSKFIDQTLPIFNTIVSEPNFDKNEISTFAIQGKQRLAVSLNKVDFLARRNFLNSIYGENTIVGKMVKAEHYDALNHDTLSNFYNDRYKKGLKAVVVAGKFTNENIESIKSLIKSLGFSKNDSTNINSEIILNPEKIYITKKDSVQSAIRIGKKMFNRKHPDYFSFSILNTVLGGYFGSRLMSNIREDKGYTYGIGSGLATNLKDGYFFISTEVGSDVCKDAIKEIYFETERLRNEKIPTDELRLVKNYLFGAFQRSIDGPFALADRQKSLYLNSLTNSHLEQYLTILAEITPEKLLECAQKHLDQSLFTEVVVGP